MDTYTIPRAGVSLCLRLFGRVAELVLLPRACDDRVVRRQSQCMFRKCCLVHKYGNLGYLNVGRFDHMRTALGAREPNTKSTARRDGAIVYDQVGT